MMPEFISWQVGVAEKNEIKGVDFEGAEGVGGVSLKNGNKASQPPQVPPAAGEKEDFG